MTVQDNWLANLRAIVDAEAKGADKRAGYRAVAQRARLSEEYVYQLYTGQLRADGAPRNIGHRTARAIERAFSEGRPHGWFDSPPAAAVETQQRATPPPLRDGTASLDEINPCAVALAIHRMLKTRPQAARNAAAELLSALARDPEQLPIVGPALVGLLGASTEDAELIVAGDWVGRSRREPRRSGEDGLPPDHGDNPHKALHITATTYEPRRGKEPKR